MLDASSINMDEEPLVERPLTLAEALRTSQFWLVYFMAFLSIFQGYYALNVFKALGYTKDALADDIFLTQVGSVAAFMGALRFVWSAALDLDGASFKLVYGVLLTIQTLLGATIEFATRSRFTYAAWMCLMLFTEGAHFTVIPNALKKIFGESASSVYGVIFTFTGLSSLLMLFIVRSDFGARYAAVFEFSACLSGLALCILLFAFSEVKRVRYGPLYGVKARDLDAQAIDKQSDVAVRGYEAPASHSAYNRSEVEAR